MEDAPYPQPTENDVIVRVHAAGFTPGELNWPGTWTDRAGRDRTPTIPGHEVSGEVAELGFGATGLSVGQRVFGMTDFSRDGTLAEYVAVETRDLAPLPATIDHVRGAALPLAGLSAWQGLFVHGQLAAGQTVVVHGAGGGVGTFAVQLAREAGARVIGTGRARDRERVLELGAEIFVDLAAEPFEQVTGLADLVFDTIGGEILDRSAEVVKPGGALITVSAPPTVGPANGRALFFIVERDRAQLVELAGRVQDGRLRVEVGAVHPLARARDAFVGKTGTPGKAVIQVAD